MSHDDFDDELESESEHEHEDEQEEEREREVEDALEEALELDTQSQIFLELRRQNVELLRIAIQVAGYTSERGPLKHGEVRNALRNIWDVYAEMYTWIDPEEAEGDEADEEGEIEVEDESN
jgi:hypothetical protein